MTNKCKYCEREINNKGSLASHEKQCKLNPSRIPNPRSPKAGLKKGNIPWNKGLTAEDERVKQGSDKLKDRYATGDLVAPPRVMSEETRKKMSISRKELYASGWESTCGRCKKYTFITKANKTIKVDGTWELKLATFLDNTNLTWVRNPKRFPYIKPTGIESTYQPDFYIKDFNLFLEVKGYETDLDRCKWSQFNENLCVLRKEDIFNLDSWYEIILLLHTKESSVIAP